MCLAIPGRVMEIAKPEGSHGDIATVDFQGTRIEVSLAMTPEAGEGDWVLIHAGFALSVLDEADARATWDSLREVLGEQIDLPGAPGGI